MPIPFPDGPNWRTLHLAVEPEDGGGDSTETPSRFRMLMHVPLTELGETIIDAGLEGERLRAVMYFDSPTIRERIRTELPELERELRTDGFREVLLDIRSTAELPDRRRKQAEAMRTGRADTNSVVDVRV